MKKNFLLGSKWLYLKIYGGPKILEKILVNKIYLNLEKSKFISKYFFIRYQDELGYHLRVRVLIENIEKTHEVLLLFNEVLEPYLEKNLIYNVSYDTYKRELERYGVETIEYCESLFHIDSATICNFIKQIQTEGNDKEKKDTFLFCVNYLDDILTCFGYTLDDKITFSKKYKEYYEKEFFSGKREKVLIDKKFRVYKKEMETKLEFQKSSFYKSMIEVYKLHSKNIKEHYETDKLGISLNYLINSLIHMTCNRLFRIKQRQYEYVIYALMEKKYNSIKARKKYDKSKF